MKRKVSLFVAAIAAMMVFSAPVQAKSTAWYAYQCRYVLKGVSPWGMYWARVCQWVWIP